MILREFKADGAKFIPAGREDIDVRMLGTGRPFVLEIHNARAPKPSRCASSAYPSGYLSFESNFDKALSKTILFL